MISALGLLDRRRVTLNATEAHADQERSGRAQRVHPTKNGHKMATLDNAPGRDQGRFRYGNGGAYGIRTRDLRLESSSGAITPSPRLTRYMPFRICNFG